MNWTAISQVAQVPEKAWYYSTSGVAVLMGCGRKQAHAFLADNSVPHYLIGRTKMYFLPEILEAIERTRWKEPEEVAQCTP